MKRISLVVTLATVFTFMLINFIFTFAATSPYLNSASTFGILSSTYTNTVVGTTINGDIGYTTGPALEPDYTGIIYQGDDTYNQAGIDQGNVLTNLNNQDCTFTFAPGAIDLATDITHGTIGVYGPGVYCIGGAASIGVGGITLDGAGTYIFRTTGALTTVAETSVTLINSASSCNVFWTPTEALTLGSNTGFKGIIISPSGITMGAGSLLNGMALAFGGTITTDSNVITVPVCTVQPVILAVEPVEPIDSVETVEVIEPIEVIEIDEPVETDEIIETDENVELIETINVVEDTEDDYVPTPYYIQNSPSFPDTGVSSKENKIPLNIIIIFGMLILTLIYSFKLAYKK